MITKEDIQDIQALIQEDLVFAAINFWGVHTSKYEVFLDIMCDVVTSRMEFLEELVD